MITVDKHGNPQPIGLIPQTIDNFKDAFVTNFKPSANRPKIMAGYEKYLNDFSGNVTKNFAHWIEGSFTTTKVGLNLVEKLSCEGYMITAFDTSVRWNLVLWEPRK